MYERTSLKTMTMTQPFFVFVYTRLLSHFICEDLNLLCLSLSMELIIL